MWKRGQVFKKKCSGEKRRQGRHLQRLPVFPPENAGAVAFLCQALEHLAPIFRWQKKQICQLVPSLHFEGYAFWITCIWAWRPMSMICSAGTKSAIIGSSNLDKSRSMDYYYWRRRARFPGKEYLNRNGEDVMSLMQQWLRRLKPPPRPFIFTPRSCHNYSLYIRSTPQHLPNYNARLQCPQYTIS